MQGGCVGCGEGGRSAQTVGTAGVSQGAGRSSNLLTGEPWRCLPSFLPLPALAKACCGKVIQPGACEGLSEKGWPTIMKARIS